MMFKLDAYGYVDCGAGYPQKPTAIWHVADRSTKLAFDLNGFDKIYRFKFRPCDDYCIVRLNKIIICRKNNPFYTIDHFKSNAVYSQGKCFHFLTRSPDIKILLFNQWVSKIVFDIEYLHVGETVLNTAFKSVMSSIDEELYAENLKHEKESAAQAKVAKEQGGILLQLHNQINAMQKKNRGATDARMQSIKNRLDWLKPFYHLAFSDQRRKSEKVASLATLTGSTLFAISQKTCRRIKKSGLFDTPYYLEQNPDILRSNINPIAHYLKTGYKNGKDPNPLFWSSFYVSKNLHSEEPGCHPLVHFIEKGFKKLDPCPLFNTCYYLSKNPELEASGQNPLHHYLKVGYKNSQNPHPLFEIRYYQREYPDVVKAGMDPLSHYIRSGFKENRNPGPFFDTAYYLDQNPEVKNTGLNPLAHFIETGQKEGRAPNRIFASIKDKPKISIIVPVYNANQLYLTKCIQSVINQWYFNWELCIVDDGSHQNETAATLRAFQHRDDRIKVKVLNENMGIATASNEGVSMATGEYIGFLDHDDELAKEALYEVVRAIDAKCPDIVYTDESVIDEKGSLLSSVFKPDFSADLLLSNNYITHFLVIRKALFDDVGGFNKTYNGAQDYDLVLKATEKATKIYHIHKVLYRWRGSADSTSVNPEAKTYAHDAGKLALKSALQRRGIDADVLDNQRLFHYHVKRNLIDQPLVSIVVPFKDESRYLEQGIDAILEKSSYSNFEIIGINNGSEKPETIETIERLRKRDDRVTFFDYPIPFNYSKINNYGVGLARGEHIVLMNNDIEIENANWIEALLAHSQRPDVGAVGAKLFYPDHTIQHAGIILGIGGFAGHSHRFYNGEDPGYYHRLMSIQNVSAVTGALMMVQTSIYQEMGGLDEVNFSVALNDVDFCLRLRKRGYLNVFTPFCRATHYESVTRGYEETPEKKKRFFNEIKQFKKKWHAALSKGDPYYNRNLTLEREDFSVKQATRGIFA